MAANDGIRRGDSERTGDLEARPPMKRGTEIELWFGLLLTLLALLCLLCSGHILTAILLPVQPTIHDALVVISKKIRTRHCIWRRQEATAGALAV